MRRCPVAYVAKTRYHNDSSLVFQQNSRKFKLSPLKRKDLCSDRRSAFQFASEFTVRTEICQEIAATYE
jgi:hypothetical protein